MSFSAAARSALGAVYLDWIDACNENDLSRVDELLHTSSRHNGQPLTPPAWAELFVSARDVVGPLSITVDYMAVDEDARCLASRLLVTCRPQKPWFGYPPMGQEVSFSEMQFAWFANDGRLARIDVVFDSAAIGRQMGDPDAHHNFTSAGTAASLGAAATSTTITNTAARTTAAAQRLLTKEQMESSFDDFVEAINSRRVRTTLNTIIHDDFHNDRTSTRDDFIDAVEGIIDAMPNVRATVRTCVVDVDAQRLVCQLELAGTLVLPLAGHEPTGRAVAFNEHGMYEWLDGRIARNWSMWDSHTMDRQLKGEL
jgi:predicted ester cyclase